MADLHLAVAPPLELGTAGFRNRIACFLIQRQLSFRLAKLPAVFAPSGLRPGLNSDLYG